jgi:hypothetical protein
MAPRMISALTGSTGARRTERNVGRGFTRTSGRAARFNFRCTFRLDGIVSLPFRVSYRPF